MKKCRHCKTLVIRGTAYHEAGCSNALADLENRCSWCHGPIRSKHWRAFRPQVCSERCYHEIMQNPGLFGGIQNLEPGQNDHKPLQPSLF